ncbi:MAG: hypothetical protein ACOWWO_01775 [Peptococcaceae bacterium]
MYNPYFPRYGECVWNNIEGLIGDDISFIVCRTMLKLPADKPDIGRLNCEQKRNIIEGVNHNTYPKEIIGQLMVDIKYEAVNLDDRYRDIFRKAQDGKEAKIEVGLGINIPYQGILRTKRQGSVIPQLKYLNIKQVGLRNIFVEGVIALAGTGNSPDTARNQRSEGFLNDSSLKLRENIPDIREPLAAQIKFNITQHKIKDGILTIKGLKDIYLMFIADKKTGENIIIVQETIPFSEEIYLMEEPLKIAHVDIVSTNTIINVLNKREVRIEGDFLLSMFQGQDIISTELLPDTVQEKEEQDRINIEIKSEELNTEKIPEKIPVDHQEPELMTRTIIDLEHKSEGTGIIRESKMTKLTKYMKKS